VILEILAIALLGESMPELQVPGMDGRGVNGVDSPLVNFVCCPVEIMRAEFLDPVLC
jgi:hypothetical protein